MPRTPNRGFHVMNADPVIVIGAGMGGLSAAIELCTQGLPVVLLERHASAGGKMRQVTVSGRALDVGPTVFTMRWVFEDLYRRAGLVFSEAVDMQGADLLARHSWVGSDPLDLFTEVERSVAAIESLCGSREAGSYREFARRSEAVFNTLDAPFMRAQRPGPIALSLHNGLRGIIDLSKTGAFETLWRSLAGTFEDERLRQLFARYSTYCGSSPFRAPATLMLIAHVERAGVWLLRGGMQALAQSLQHSAEQLGVDCRFNQHVERIETRGNRVRNVILANGDVLPASAVVFNGDTNALCAGLLGDAVQKATPARTEASLSAITRATVARVSGFPLAHHSVLFGGDYPREFSSVFDQATVPPDPTVYICAQDRDGFVPRAGNNDSPERLFCLINAPARELSGEETDAALANLDAALKSHGLHLHDDAADARVTGPGDFAELFPATRGALYGRPTHGWLGSFRRPGARSRVQGLYLAGGSVHPGAGVPMAALGGRLAAEQLLADR